MLSLKENDGIALTKIEDALLDEFLKDNPLFKRNDVEEKLRYYNT